MVFRGLAVAVGIGAIAFGCASMNLPGLSKLPGQSGASSTLQNDALQYVMILDMAADNSVCRQRKVVNTEIVDYPKNPGKDLWTEKWTVDRCGKTAYYKIAFTPTPQIGGTDIRVSVWK